MTLAEAPFVLIAAGIAIYAVLGGADFGAAFWQLGARGERGPALRDHAYRAMGPVWEANHVWLVFVLVICWTAYPPVFASIFSTLAAPLFIAGLGIVLRGTAYAVHAGTAGAIERRAVDGVFAVSSILTPFALGAAVGAIASGRVPVGNATGDALTSWVNPTSLAIGVLAVASGVYLAAVYLAGDARRAGHDDIAEAFRRRALAAGVLTGLVAFVALVVVAADAGRVGDRLLEWPAIGAVAVSAVAGVATLHLVRSSRFEAARYTAATAVACVVVGWAIAQQDELLPGLTIEEAAAGEMTLRATVAVAAALGVAVLAPSIALLFGLVLRGYFDREEPARRAPAQMRRAAARRRMPLSRLAAAVGASGVILSLVADGGPFHALGIALLLAFVALATAAILGSDAEEQLADS